MRIVSILAVVSLLATGGCASLYINDADLAKQADTADTAVQGADTVKPYTVQLANLQTLGAQEDQAVAALGVARRDLFVTEHLSEPPAALATSLDTQACKQLAALAGGQPCAQVPAEQARFDALFALSVRIAGFQRLVDEDRATAASSQAAYERVKAKDDTDKDSCDVLASLTTAPPMVSASAQAAFQAVLEDCSTLREAQKALADVAPQAHFDPASPLGLALAQSAPPPKSAAAAGPSDASLKQQIADAAALAKAGDVATLATFQKNLETALTGASSAAKIAGLKTLQTGLTDTLDGVLCVPPPASGTDCKSITAAATSGRAAAVWNALQALAQALDAADPRYRSANWLVAANAILAAEKQDAQIQTAAETQAAALGQARLIRLGAAASDFASVHKYARPGGLPCPGVDAAYCGLAANVAAWNEGLIPADVLAYRETLLFSQMTVQRLRAAQTEQQAITRAASASLKAYADGGIPPSVIAQLLVDVGLIGAAAAK